MFACLGLSFSDSESKNPLCLKTLNTEIIAWKQDLSKSGYIHKIIVGTQAVAMGGERMTEEALNFSDIAQERYARYI